MVTQWRCINIISKYIFGWKVLWDNKTCFVFLLKVSLFSDWGQGFEMTVEPFTCGDNCLSCLGFPDKSWKVNIATHWSLNNCLITLEFSTERERESHTITEETAAWWFQVVIIRLVNTNTALMMVILITNDCDSYHSRKFLSVKYVQLWQKYNT